MTVFFPAIFYTLPARFSLADEHEENPIFLAVSKGKLCLCCEMDKKNNQPILQLKVSTPIQFPVPSATPKRKAKTHHVSHSPQILTLADSAGAPPPEALGRRASCPPTCLWAPRAHRLIFSHSEAMLANQSLLPNRSSVLIS